MSKTAKDKLGCPEIRKFRLEQRQPAEYNPREISDDALAGLSASLKKFGCVEPIVVNTRGGKNTIVGGNQRFKVLSAAGVKECICVAVDLSETDEETLNLTLNNPKIQGEFIREIEEYLYKLQREIPRKSFIDLRIADLQSEIGQPEKSGNILDDEIPPPPKKAITKPGDLWILGEHKLLCGDSTNQTDVARLMGRERASLFATDPPYCVDYTGPDRPGGGKDWSDTFHDGKNEDIKKFWKQFLIVGLKYIKKNTAIYLWYADRKRGDVEEVCNELNILVHQAIIWVKPCVVVGYSFYSWRHEPCLLMWVRNSSPRHRPPYKAKTIGTVWPVGYIKSGDPTTPEYYTDVWELDWEGKKRNPGIEHPTVKPVEVFAIPMRVHTKVGDICYEPFCGSGSQIIAAEKLDRRCFAMELEPVFCDVTVKRWEQWIGKKAKKLKK